MIDLPVTIELTEDLVWQSASGPTQGFGFQLNAYSPSADLSGYQQYVIALLGTELAAGINNWASNGLIIDYNDNLTSLPGVTVPAGYILQISLQNDDNGNVVAATFVVIDNQGNVQANVTEDLLSVGRVRCPFTGPVGPAVGRLYLANR